MSRAYGRWADFLFGWVQLAVVRPGDIVVMAFAFATYARTIWDPFYGGALQGWSQAIFATAAVLVFTLLNVLGVREGKWTQNLLTTAKAAGLLAIVGVALVAPQVSPGPIDVTPLPPSLALLFVLFVYGGWNEMAYVAAEVKNPNRKIVRALVLGTAAVTILYLLVNGAFRVGPPHARPAVRVRRFRARAWPAGHHRGRRWRGPPARHGRGQDVPAGPSATRCSPRR